MDNMLLSSEILHCVFPENKEILVHMHSTVINTENVTLTQHSTMTSNATRIHVGLPVY